MVGVESRSERESRRPEVLAIGEAIGWRNGGGAARVAPIVVLAGCFDGRARGGCGATTCGDAGATGFEATTALFVALSCFALPIKPMKYAVSVMMADSVKRIAGTSS